MAKEFKQFEQKYRHLAGTALKSIEAISGRIPRDDITAMTEWPHMLYFTEAYSVGEIRHAVYESSGAENWQKFRVALKGLSCMEKLYALNWYWYRNIVSGTKGQAALQTVRINNYLGALKRGGFLDSQLRVIKN